MSATTEASAANGIRPFTIEVHEAELDDPRGCIAATRRPESETVADRRGVQSATIQALAQYWASDYDWRKVGAKLNALPQSMTEIDGIDIHFIHVKSPHENALPLIITHGWPGSVVEMLNVVGPLSDPTAHGGSTEDAFHLVIRSMPGYGCSGKAPYQAPRSWAESAYPNLIHFNEVDKGKHFATEVRAGFQSLK